MPEPKDDLVFQSWLGKKWKTSSEAVAQILDDPRAIQFLIAWSILESNLFGGYLRSAEIGPFARSYAPNEQDRKLLIAAEHFYQRYQDRKLYKNLMHDSKCQRLEKIIKQRNFDTLNEEERIFLLMWVIYRYRNNIFHGNKSVQSWLKYQEQIVFCISTMRIIIDTAGCRR